MNRKFALVAGVSIELVGLMILAVVIGNYLELNWPLKGLWLLVTCGVSFFLWVGHIFYVLRKAEKIID